MTTVMRWCAGGRRCGQSALEYAVLLAVVSAAVVGMSIYIRRAVQANIKTTEMQLNPEALQ